MACEPDTYVALTRDLVRQGHVTVQVYCLFEFQCHIVLIRHCYFQLIAQILGIRTGQRSSVTLCSFLYFIFCFIFCFIRVCLITFYFVYCIISIPRIDCINCIHLNLSSAKFRIKIAKEPGGSAPQKHCFQLTPLRRLIDCQLKYHL